MILEGLLNVVNKFIPDGTKQAELKAEIEKQINDGNLQIELSQQKSIQLLIERNTIPMVYYMFLLILFNNYVISPYVTYLGGQPLPILQVPEELYNLITWITMGLFGKKVGDKLVKGGK